MISRREAIKIGTASVLYCVHTRVSAQQSSAILEEQRGDPDGPYETLEFDADAVRDLIFAPQKAAFAEYKREMPLQCLQTASENIGRSRTSHRELITEFLDLFRLPFEIGGKPVPYCAAGLAFVAAETYANLLGMPTSQFDKIRKYRSILADLEHWYFYPSPSCWDIYHVAAGKRRWVDNLAKMGPVVLRAGWIVICDFGRGADHCSMVESADTKTVETIAS